MLRQDQSPISYQATRRPDNVSLTTTCRAGEVAPVSAGYLLRGDSASGRTDIQFELAEMPKPLENLVIGRGQTWVVPRPALPHFESIAEYNHAYEGTNISKLGGASRTPPSLFDTVGTGAIAAAQTSEFFKTLGIHLRASTAINTDYVDAYNLIYNFRLAAHSSKLTRVDYYSEDAVTSLELKPAFWPVSPINIVPDYESALVQGALELDVAAGQAPVQWDIRHAGGSGYGVIGASDSQIGAGEGSKVYSGLDEIYASMAGQTLSTTLADIDKARLTESMAKARTAMAGTNYSGYNSDDVIVAALMQGYVIPPEMFQRPILLDSKTFTFGMNEKHATDSGNLDDSVSVGSASVSLSMNIPRMDWGAVYITTVEIMPEKLYTRLEDPYLHITDVADLPNALRDVQNTLPVDIVNNDRIDQAHGTPDGIFGYEPMNAKHRRNFTRFGGEYRQTTPGTPITTARNAIWQPDVVDQAFTSDMWLCPHPFPQDVFSAPSSDVVTISLQQTLAITGLTQFGDELVESNDEFADTQSEQP